MEPSSVAKEEEHCHLSNASCNAHAFSRLSRLLHWLISYVSRKQPMQTCPLKKFELYLHNLTQGVDRKLGSLLGWLGNVVDIAEKVSRNRWGVMMTNNDAKQHSLILCRSMVNIERVNAVAESATVYFYLRLIRVCTAGTWYQVPRLSVR